MIFGGDVSGTELLDGLRCAVGESASPRVNLMPTVTPAATRTSTPAMAPMTNAGRDRRGGGGGGAFQGGLGGTHWPGPGGHGPGGGGPYGGGRWPKLCGSFVTDRSFRCTVTVTVQVKNSHRRGGGFPALMGYVARHG